MPVPIINGAAGVPTVDKSSLNIQGVQIALVFDVHPERYPNGVEFLILPKGSLAPIGKIEAQPGAMLLAPPPDFAAHLRSGMERELKQAEEKARRLAEQG